MSIINDGKISLTTASGTVTGTDTLFLTRLIESGYLLYPEGYPDPLHILSDATSETSLTILEDWNGPTETLINYEIVKDFYDYEIPVLSPDQTDTAYKINTAHQRIIDALNSLGASPTKKQITTKIFLGEPVLNQEWGFLKFTPDVVISKIRLYTDNTAPDGALVADLAVDGTYQNINITVPVNNLWSLNNTLTTAVDAGEFTKLKWTTVPGMPGSNWFAEITWYAITPLITRYDCLVMMLGDLDTYANTGKIFGNGFKYPVNSKLFGLHYEFTNNPPLGSAAIIEVYKNGVAIGTPVTFTFTAGQLWGYIACAQTSFLTTDIQTFIITQIGSDMPGSGLIMTPHTYQYTP